MTTPHPKGALVLALAPEGQDCLIGRVVGPPETRGAYVLRNWDWAAGRWTGMRRVPQDCVVGVVPPDVPVDEIAYELIGHRNKARQAVYSRDWHLRRAAARIIRRHGGILDV